MTEPDGHVHVMPNYGPVHEESKGCWCEPELIQEIDDEHDKQVWLHKELQ